MRITMLAIALVVGAAPALADPRIIVVEDPVSASGTTPVPATPASRLTTEATPTQPSAPPAEEGNEPSAPPSRFSFRRVDDGFLRLDNQSGQVTFCSVHSVGWACEAVPEDRAALEQEIGRLRDEVVRLKDELATLRAPATPPRPPGDLTPRSDQDGGLKLPSDEDIARARAAVENAWRRLMEMMKNLQDDMTRKN